VGLLILGCFGPTVQVVGDIVAILDGDDLSDLVREKSEGASTADNAKRGVHLVENENFRVETASECRQANTSGAFLLLPSAYPAV
jgi:hypothetical protein